MKFKYRPYKVPRNEQGLIYFTCINYNKQPPEVQQKILNLCTEVGGEHYQALFEAVTTDRNMQPIADKYYIDHSTLCRLCQKFYENWKCCKWEHP